MASPSLAPEAGSSSYSSLWKAEQKLEADGKPQSAYAATMKILQKAEKKGHRGQALSARLRAAALHQEWAPDSFFTDIQKLENLRRRETSPEARAIYASILAEIYEQNKGRSQAYDLELTSNQMKEWTQQQYDSAATANWNLSLADIAVLGKAKSRDWLPFVKQNTASEYFRHDLLHILWQRVRDQRQTLWGGQHQTIEEQRKRIEEYYRLQGNREAALLIALDGKPDLDELKEEFADLPLCTEVYLRLMSSYAPDSQKIAWAEEAIQRYPRYQRIGEVRNALNELRRPAVYWYGADLYYPGKNYQWRLATKNTSAVRLEVFRLKAELQSSAVKASKLSLSDYLHRNATLVQTLTPDIRRGAPAKTLEDTLEWTAPEVGLYALLFTATTDEREANQQTIDTEYHTFRVTALRTMERTLPDSTYEVIVVDAESGQPVREADVTLYQIDYRTKKQTIIGKMKSDAEGRTHFTDLKRSETQFYVEARKGDDRWLPEHFIFREAPTLPYDQGAEVIRLYTDRAIYRPGQSVHLGGIVYREKHWDATPVDGRELELILRDANGKEVSRQTVKADEWGILSADFILPEGRLPGRYSIQTNNTRIGFRVEEYKRPTFDVTMEEAPALQWPQDSIVLTGQAMGFNGVPVRSGRITGTYQFTYPYYWWYRHDDSPRQQIDTLWTDDAGMLRVAVPLKKIPKEALRFGLYLALDVQVLSPAGETREGSIRVPLCTEPLRLSVTMNEQQERSRITPPVFSLISSTGQPVQGEILCSLFTRSSKEAVATGVPQDRLAETLRQLPSGEYTLHAKARAGTDTASAKASFFIFSINDRRLPRHAGCWLYCPSDSFDSQHPARLHVGSSFSDVALYYCLTAPHGVIEDRLIQLSDEARLIEIPYKKEYGDGVVATFAFVKHGEHYQRTQALRLTLPDRQLRWQWTSFRDRLHPGDREQWTLRLTTPDGTPAAANLMAVVYDASLDLLAPHHWQLNLARYHRLRQCKWSTHSPYNWTYASEQLPFTMKSYTSRDLDFDIFDNTWTDGLYFYGRYNGALRRLTRAKGGMRNEEALFATEEMMVPAMAMMSKETAEDSAPDEGASESADQKEAATAPTVSAAPATLRTNFNETAAFMPRLHTNANTGEVTLSFTLPESLTTWQLLGVAHTQDFFTTDIQAQAVARKELMARLYLPRFLRAGDQSTLRATVQNLTGQALNGKATLEVFNPEDNKLLLRRTTSFKAEANGEDVLSFDYTPTEDLPLVAVRLVAETTPARKRAVFSDGEQHYLAILPSKEWVTESVEIRADSAGTFTTDLSALFNKNNPTATQRRLTVEYTTHPIWNVVQALPSLREAQNDDVLSLTSVFYANALSAYIAATTPRLRDVITLWKQQAASASEKTTTGKKPAKQATVSPLELDEELKQLALDETPWLREACTDTERRAQLIDLFNENLIEQRLTSALDRLRQRQRNDGGFSWFPGMRSSELMTRVIAIELTRLRALTNDFDALPHSVKQQTDNLLEKAFAFIATENADLIRHMKEREKKGETVQTGSLMHLHYVYIAQRAGVQLTKSQRADVRYLLDHLKGSVAGLSNDERAVAAIVLKADGRKKEAQLYYESMLEHLTTTDRHGTYFDYAGGSFTPTGHKIAIHTAAMEAVEDFSDSTAPAGSSHRRGLRRWLLQQKRTQMWDSGINTTNAIYALLHSHATSSAAAELEDTSRDRLDLHFGKRTVTLSSPAGKPTTTDSPAALGHLRATYTDGTAPTSITVERSAATEAWGAVHAQYLTPLTDASAHAGGLTIRRELSATTPRLGDKLTTRYIITADRDYEYVCLRADRAACAEPAEANSGYCYQGGLGYYRAVRDAHTDFFFDRLPKGTYVLEETAFIDRTGHYTTGLCRLQCLYAPEYNSHTSATTLSVSEEKPTPAPSR